MLKRTIIPVLAILLIGVPCSFADIIDLTYNDDLTNPIYVGIEADDGSIWRVAAGQPTGTGVYEPFLRYQANGVETGLNTNDKPVPYDDKMPVDQYTRAVLFEDLVEVMYGGELYWSFTIDINEPDNDDRWLSFDTFNIWQGDQPDYDDIDDIDDFDPLVDLLFESEATVLANYDSVSSGSGKDDIEFLIPVQDYNKEWMYLYIISGDYNPSEGEIGYGRVWTSEAGFEEIRTTGIPAPVPEPATMLLLGTGLIGVACLGRKKFRKGK